MKELVVCLVCYFLVVIDRQKMRELFVHAVTLLSLHFMQNGVRSDYPFAGVSVSF